MIGWGSLIKKPLRASEQNRPDIAARGSGGDGCNLLGAPNSTSSSTKPDSTYGRSQVGTRAHGSVPHGYWNTSTFVAALRHGRIEARLLIEGAMDGAMFLTYVEQQLLPTPSAGDMVIFDNLAAHKVLGVRHTIESVGAQLIHLPPFIARISTPSKWRSPNSNPCSELSLAELGLNSSKLSIPSWIHSLPNCVKTCLNTVAMSKLNSETL